MDASERWPEGRGEGRGGRHRMSKHRKDDAKQRAAEPARQVALARELVPGGTTFAPGVPTRPVGGLTDAQGAPRQWGYPVGYNIIPRPASAGQTTLCQL